MAAPQNIAAITAQLTRNAAINLRRAAERGLLDQQTGRLYTGPGKWTTLAAIGIENHLKKLGLIEFQHLNGRPNMVRHWSPLGREVAQFVHEHWEELTFR